MKLHPGKSEEYKKRHDEIWPDLKALLKGAGVEDYSIFHDETTNDLFGVLVIADHQKMKDLSQLAIMKKWWAYMRDLMDTNADNSPVSIPLKEVFYME